MQTCILMVNNNIVMLVYEVHAAETFILSIIKYSFFRRAGNFSGHVREYISAILNFAYSFHSNATYINIIM